MCFNNRCDVAEQPGEVLRVYHGRDSLMLAIPRGAIPMGRLLAQRLDGELDVVLVRKLGAAGADAVRARVGNAGLRRAGGVARQPGLGATARQ